MSDATDVLVATGVCKAYQQGADRIEVLQDVNLRIEAGELVALVGRSGSGKSTLLHVLAGLEDVDAGEVFIAGQPLQSVGGEARAELRNAYLGFVYQMHHLLAEFTALENVAMPLRIAGVSRRAAESAARDMLDAVGLSARARHRPSELSGGERQRVAVARALVAQPKVVLADEPTGNLDRQSADQVMALITELCRSRGVGFLIATHDSNIAQSVDRVVTLAGGEIT